jgi:hypothetical protein
LQFRHQVMGAGSTCGSAEKPYPPPRSYAKFDPCHYQNRSTLTAFVLLMK